MTDAEELIALRRMAELEAKNSGNSDSRVALNSMAKGMAAIPDSILNTPTNIFNLLKIPVGIGHTASGRPDLAPEITPQPNFVKNLFTKFGAIGPAGEPSNDRQKIIDMIAQGAGSSMFVPSASGVSLLNNAILGGVSGGAAEQTRQSTGSDVAGAAVGLAAPFVAATAINAAGSLANKTANSLYHSALKPSSTYSAKDVDKAINTLLDEGINVSRSGVNKLDSKISDLNNQVKTAIGNSSATIDKINAIKPLADVRNTFGKTVDPMADLNTINTVESNFLNHPLISGNKIPAQLAQELKTNTYKVLRDKYGQLGTADVESQKAIARGLKNEIAQSIPGIGNINAKESQLLNALPMLEHRVLIEGNKNPVGLTMLTPNAGQAAGFMADRSAWIKSLLARLAHQGGGILSPDKVTPLNSMIMNAPYSQGILQQRQA